MLARIGAICDEFECYGYRRVGAALRHQGVVVNGKKLRRLMREHGLQPKRRRRYVVTTDSDHAGPIFPDLAKNYGSRSAQPAWVADLTYVAIPGGFVYLAAILDAWSRKVVGYAIRRSIDARMRGCAEGRDRAATRQGLHPSFRSGFAICVRDLSCAATAHGLVGSMSRRGNPYDNAKAESFMKTLKVEAVYLALTKPSKMSPPTSRASLRRSTMKNAYIRRLGYLSPAQFEDNTPGRRSKQPLETVHPEGRTPDRA